jgi:predicted ATP-binding protein involved in virulence
MFISSIQARNFKGFEQRSFQLNQHFTVAIGNNGQGKSSLLASLQVGLGAFLVSMPTLPANHLYRRQFRPQERFRKYHPNRRDFLPNTENPAIAITASCQTPNGMENISWVREYLGSKTSYNHEHTAQIAAYAQYIFEQQHLEHVTYPVLANFQINRTNAQVKKVDKSWRRMSRLEKGYYAALGDTVNFSGVYEWLYAYPKLLQDGKEFDGTREAFYQAVRSAIPYIHEIEYNSLYEEFEMLAALDTETPPQRLLASDLSDGMLAMLHLVAEIAYRCIMLNGKLGQQAVQRSSGVVLIDEIDMHLHPQWQRHVVGDLKAAFPNIQFVATTHSPFIVQSLQADELINLDRPEDHPDVDPKALSIDMVSHELMGVESNYGIENAEAEHSSHEYLELLQQAENAETPQNFVEPLERLEANISDPGLRAFLRMNRIAKNII